MRDPSDWVPRLLSLRHLEVLVRTCLGDRRVTARARRLLFVLCDFPFWKQLADRGMPRSAIPETVIDLVRSVLETEETS